MNRKHLLGAVILVLVVGYTSYFYIRSLRVQGTNSVSKPAPPTFEPWHRQSKLPWEIDPATVACRDPRLGEMLQLIDREIRQLDSAAWNTSAPKQYPFIATHDRLGPYYKRTYVATWTSSGKPNESSANPTLQQQLSIKIELQESQPQVERFEVRGRLEKQNGCVVEWFFHMRGQGIERAWMRVKHPALVHQKYSDFREGAFMLPSGLMYDYSSGELPQSSHSMTLRNGATQPSDRDQISVFQRYWKSPAEFEATWLAEIDGLDQALQDWLTAGGKLTRWGGGDRGDNPPYPLGEDPARLGIKLRIITEVTLLNEARRRMVREHGAEIYESLLGSFPSLPKLLQDLQPVMQP